MQMNHYHPILSPGFFYAFFVPIFHQSMKIYTLSGYNLSGEMRFHDSRRVAAQKVEVEVKAEQ
jgi:hypothetical protein